MLIGATFLTSGTVVVAIRISLALKLFDYSKYDPPHWPSRPGISNHLYDLDADCKGEVALFQFCNKLFQQGLNRRRGLAIRAIIVPLRPSPGLVWGPRAPISRWKAAVVGSTLPRWLMTPIEIVGGLFGLFAVGLIVLLIYKSTLTMHEDDQLFLDDANSHMQEEQTELLAKVNKLTVPMRVFSIGSGVFLLAFLAMLIYQKLNEVQ
jgi:hypothetical protein